MFLCRAKTSGLLAMRGQWAIQLLAYPVLLVTAAHQEVEYAPWVTHMVSLPLLRVNIRETAGDPQGILTTKVPIYSRPLHVQFHAGGPYFVDLAAAIRFGPAAGYVELYGSCALHVMDQNCQT